MEFLTLAFALYTGGIIATIGFMCAGMRQDNALNRKTSIFTYLYALTCCVAWPFTIAEQIINKNPNEN